VAVGVITEALLVRRLGLGQTEFFTTRASDVMAHEFITCVKDELLSDVLATMHARSFIHVLLLDAEHKPIGVLNARDGLRALLSAGNYEEELLRNYVMGIGYQ
jgi:CBS domain-containing protein